MLKNIKIVLKRFLLSSIKVIPIPITRFFAAIYLRQVFSGEVAEFGTQNQQNRESWIKQELSIIPKGQKILDAGAGERPYQEYCSHLNYVSQDFCEYTGSGDGTGLQMGTWETKGVDIVSDIAAIPVEDSSFDAILCSEVFEHIPDPKAALKEFSRILKPNGVLLLTAPVCSLTHFAPYFFSTGFSRYFYTHHLPELGFRVEDIISNGNYYEYLGQELRRAQGNKKDREVNKTKTTVDDLIVQRTLAILRDMTIDPKDALRELALFGYHVKAVKI